ncbi:SDR family oxidoreductase [Streptomyces sp. NPDC006516]|uniref:SDR family oxidoreductase n=1 Tax=Streptomyces sp. NPDC006516 TaxID=3154309 RepID=UPI0033BD5D92
MPAVAAGDRPAGTPGDGVVIVGAGPVGLLLAGDLAAHGVPTDVIEQRAAPMTESRASTLHARTMELLARRGILERLGPLPDGGPGHFGGLRLDLRAADPAHPYAGQWKCPQTRLEAVLQERAGELGARVHRGTRLVTLHDRGPQVRVEAVGAAGTQRFAAAYVVGCDGDRSTVRRLGSFGFPGTRAGREMLRADVVGLDVEDRRFERHPRGLATAHRWPDGSTRIMVHVFGTAAPVRTGPPLFTEVTAAWTEVTGQDIGHGTPVWLNAFDDTSRQADRYRRGRVFLAGDAAHVQMPVGGQALNLGLQDAADLGGRLAARLAPSTGPGTPAHPDPLPGYDRTRRAVGARTLTDIRAQSYLLLGGAEVEPLRELFSELLGLGAVRRHLARGISGLRWPREAAADPRPTAPPTTATPPSPRDTDDRSTDMGRLTDKTALVTGSSRGIGRAVARRLAGDGALVAVHYANDEDAARQTVELIEGDGGRAFAVRAELGVAGDVHELFLGLEQGLKDRTGETGLDIVVNNAGVTTPAGVVPEDVTPEEFDRLFSVNTKAPFFIVQRALPLLREGGRIVNVSSGLTRFASPDQVAYAMTKGALEQIALHFARHLAPRGITVNSVAPGITDNGSALFDIPEAVEQMAQFSAFKRVGKAADVADVVAFLVSDDARWVTGAFIDASGGTLLG